MTKPSLADLAIWFDFEANGNDSHTGENDLTEINGPLSYVAGLPGNGADIEWDSAQGLYVAAPHDGHLGADDFTISGWVKPEELREKSDYTQVTRCGGSQWQGGYDLKFANEVGGTASANLACMLYSNNGTGAATIHGNGIFAGDNYFFAAVHDTAAETWTVYGNQAGGLGTVAEEASMSTTGRVVATPAGMNLLVGAITPTPVMSFDGIISQLTYWNAALTLANMEWLEGGGSGRSYADMADDDPAGYNKVDLSLGLRL